MIKCPDCGAESHELHTAECQHIARMMASQQRAFRASQQYKPGWSDPRGMAQPTPIRQVPPRVRTWLDRHGRQIGEWCREYWRAILIVIIWGSIVWELWR